MSANTIKRIISAVVMAAIVAICIFYGKESTLGLILFAGIIAVDELFVNLLKKLRFSFTYLISQILFILPFVYFNFLDFTSGMHFAIVNVALLLNILLLFYLFYIPMESKSVEEISNKLPYVSGIFFVLPMISLTNILHYSEWRILLFILLVVNFGMDTGAWFFGKNFGSHKLWEKVSPNKTIEGLIGGMFTAGVLGYITWTFLIAKPEILLFFVFCLLGVLSQLGDLIQSKMKRQFKIKDSSSLIPGHGGVYDRIDSLLYSAPFFAVILKYFYK